MGTDENFWRQAPTHIFSALFLLFPLHASHSSVSCIQKAIAKLGEQSFPDLVFSEQVSLGPKVLKRQHITDISKFVDTSVGDTRGFVILFRGQHLRTKTVKAPLVQKVGINKASKIFSKMLKEAERDLKDDRALLKDRIRRESNSNYTSKHGKRSKKRAARAIMRFQYGLSGLDAMSPLEYLAKNHSYTSTDHPLVSATRSLPVAAGDFGPEKPIRYIYILKAPVSAVINTSAAVEKGRGFLKLQDELEVSIPLSATEHVISIYDLKKSKFVFIKN